MFVRDWMTRKVVAIAPEATVLNARRLLVAHGVRHLPVVDGHHVVGMLSDRDLLVRDAQVGQVRSALQSDLLAGRYRAVASVMSAPVHVVAPVAPVRDAVQTMLDQRVGALPVVERTRLVGIITVGDCVRALTEELTRPGVRPERDPDPDWYKSVPMPAGDERPGRPVPSVATEGGHVDELALR